MTAVVSRERAARTGLTAAAGVLMLAVAFVMMVVAAPGHGHVRAHLAQPSAVRLATDVCHQLTSRGDSPAVRACRAIRPPLALPITPPRHMARAKSAGRAAPGPNGARP